MTDKQVNMIVNTIEKVSENIGRNSLVSPNESDRNGEAANVVDGLFAIARGLHAVAAAIKSERGER